MRILQQTIVELMSKTDDKCLDKKENLIMRMLLQARKDIEDKQIPLKQENKLKTICFSMNSLTL